MPSKVKQKFYIKDWMGKILFGGKTFPTFQDGWSFIYENDPEPDTVLRSVSDHWYDGYYVELVPRGVK